jgi:hypothetical protein
LGTSKTDGQRTTDFLGWNGTSLSSRAETPWNHRPPNAAATGYASGFEFRNLGWLRLTKCDVAKLGPRLALQNRIPETPAFPDHRTCRVFRPAKAESRPAAAWSSPAFSGSHGHNHDHSADQAGAMGRRWPAQEAAPRRLPSRLVLVAGLRLQHDRPLRSLGSSVRDITLKPRQQPARRLFSSTCLRCRARRPRLHPIPSAFLGDSARSRPRTLRESTQQLASIHDTTRQPQQGPPGTRSTQFLLLQHKIIIVRQAAAGSGSWTPHWAPRLATPSFPPMAGLTMRPPCALPSR